MKKFLIALGLCLCFAFPVQARDITAEWDQEICEGFTGWRLYCSVDSPGGPYDYWEVHIPYDGSGRTS
jgi:hypothetical protein